MIKGVELFGPALLWQNRVTDLHRFDQRTVTVTNIAVLLQDLQEAVQAQAFETGVACLQDNLIE